MDSLNFLVHAVERESSIKTAWTRTLGSDSRAASSPQCYVPAFLRVSCVILTFHLPGKYVACNLDRRHVWWVFTAIRPLFRSAAFFRLCDSYFAQFTGWDTRTIIGDRSSWTLCANFRLAKCALAREHLADTFPSAGEINDFSNVYPDRRENK